MSLINDALKKAQMEQQGKSAPAARDPDVASAASGGAGGSGRALLIGGALVAVVGGVAAWYFMAGPSESGRAATSHPEVAAAKTEPVAVAPAVVKSVDSAKPVPAIATDADKPVDAVVAPTTETSVAPAPKPPVEVVAVTPAAPAPVEPVKPVARPAPKPDARVRAMVDVMKITGVRASTGRCIIDGTLRKEGDRVSDEPVIQLKAIHPDALIFSDINGVEYEARLK